MRGPFLERLIVFDAFLGFLGDGSTVLGVDGAHEHLHQRHFFERQFTIETVRAYKPAQQVYHMVAQELDVPPSTCFMVAAHVWDTVGAQSAGYTAGLVTRPGNAPLPVASLPQPNLIAPDLPALARQLIQVWRS